MYDDTIETVTDDTLPGWRARIVPDYDAQPPYDEGAAPILQFADYRTPVTQAGNGSQYVVPSNILEAAERWGSEPDTLERFLRIFHGVTRVEWISTRDGQWVAFDPAAWRDAMGISDPSTMGRLSTEWRAYVEGDVWGIIVERLETWTSSHGDTRESWEPVDSVWGFYGGSYTLASGEAWELLHELATVDA